MGHENELVKGNTPMLILAVLQDQPLHGYAIAREIERRSETVLRMNEGALYPTLKSLEQQGRIVGEWERLAGKRARKVYRLLPAGRAVLEDHCRTWSRFSQAIERVIGGEKNERTIEPQEGHPRRSPRLLPDPTHG